MKPPNCKNCGRFFRPLHSGDETCSYSCWRDVENGRERLQRFSGRTLAEKWAEEDEERQGEIDRFDRNYPEW